MSKPQKTKKILITLLLLIGLFPTIWAVWSIFSGSLMAKDELNHTIGPVISGREGMASWPLLPSYPTLQPLTELLLDTPQFFVMFWNSFKLVVPSVLGQLLFGTPAAWALSRFRFRGRKALLAFYISLMLLPFQVTMVPNYLTINSLHLMDTIWAVILPFAFSAFPVFIMTKGFDSVHRSIIEAADVDGAGYVRTFISIGLPLGVPGILSALVMGFLDTWNAIEQPMLFLKTPSLWPLSLYLPRIAEEKLGVAMVSSLIMLLPAALIFLFGQKYLVLGIQSAGVKE
ncbi:carbohydrate ABC transporter permease [Scatolibacter rhodanostii]|uniref:carbohydrate ABC transporter permease n=1 Tax=Scatolibacter rhodanostii TaxID=2014781 RepID=UPI001FA8202F|nr:carbohydrate ABC transporter permease [Scatolibacter rhodanostii]